MTTSHIVINSNKWFSAVSDYSFQLARYLSSSPKDELICFVAHEDSPLKSKIEHEHIPFLSMPLLPSGPVGFAKSWALLTRTLENYGTDDVVVWTFEGREHTLCALHRLANGKLWNSKKLVRVRGQAAKLKGGVFEKKLYTELTDKVIFASSKSARECPYYFGSGQAHVQLYCAGSLKQPTEVLLATFEFAPDVPPIDFSKPTLLVVGRYDPIKGHQNLLEAFAKCRFENSETVQLVFVGNTQNVKASDLHEFAKRDMPKAVSRGTRYFNESADSKKRLYIFDERVEAVGPLMARAHFGVIPSLGSEVICRVAVEFLQKATPLVSSQVGALPEVLAGTSSRLFAHENMQSIVDALEWSVEIANDKARHDAFRASSEKMGFEKFALSRFSDVVAWANS